MIRKRAAPRPHLRQKPIEVEDTQEPEEEAQDKLELADLIELRKLRRAREGIDTQTLVKGDAKKKKKRPREGEEEVGGLKKGSSSKEDEEDEEADAEAKARRVVRTNNFTQQTNVLDVDKHMMAYIEENMKARRGTSNEPQKDEGPRDPYAELFDIYKLKQEKEQDEGSVTNSLAMLTAIPEVDLGMDTRLKNIEDTEKAKRILTEERKDRPKKAGNDEEHLAASRFYRPNLKAKSDADIIRDAKLEAMGLLPEDHEPRPPRNDRPQMATDEMVMERFKKRMRK
ncbi:hepatocellular carcinoma-associated antigen 59-domain-containing protein [Fomitopsis serialis]|uniref:hepatocellular carcinoma-associated antigen 59-domain-containing protein n=1 Tax=Fomitopsis serialis TaxID=139415 RepID=UPI0020078B69|nr:hepatocellular carcinoma-associated antigen 59-domain-containing protein [Neoantrodia serialis]KAH9938027.1 hepatocellular carcinoma-associated antigen 59-domain-containing protein [Neoantrodia serialis]